LHSEGILPCPNIRRDIELSGQAAILAVAHLLTIDPHIESRIHRLEQQVDVASQPG
jgi:hypothetical protein